MVLCGKQEWLRGCCVMPSDLPTPRIRSMYECELAICYGNLTIAGEGNLRQVTIPFRGSSSTSCYGNWHKGLRNAGRWPECDLS